MRCYWLGGGGGGGRGGGGTDELSCVSKYANKKQKQAQAAPSVVCLACYHEHFLPVCGGCKQGNPCQKSSLGDMYPPPLSCVPSQGNPCQKLSMV